MEAAVVPVWICCGGMVLLALLVALPLWLLQRGFDLLVGCLGNLFVIGVAAGLLLVYWVSADVAICQVWLIGEIGCSILHLN